MNRFRLLLVLAAVSTLSASAWCTEMGWNAAQEPPAIVPRAAWGAKPAEAALMREQSLREIIVHHTSVRQQPGLSLEKKLQGLQAFSQRQGQVGTRLKPAWGDVPYHYYIDVTGRIGEGRALSYAGDTNTKYDTMNRIQIVVEGHFDSEEPSAGQIVALKGLVQWLSTKYKIPGDKISAHNDHAATDCPGRNLKRFMDDLRKTASVAKP